MAGAANGLLLMAAVIFIVISYLTNAVAQSGRGVPGQPASVTRLWLIYHLATWLAPVSIVGLAVHLTIGSILRLGPAATPFFLAVAAGLALTASGMAVEVWRTL